MNLFILSLLLIDFEIDFEIEIINMLDSRIFLYGKVVLIDNIIYIFYVNT